VLVGMPLIGVALINAALGHCAPGAECIDGWKLILGAIIAAALIGLAVRATVNALLNRQRNDRQLRESDRPDI
jgi:hypothetical protein